MKIKQIKDLVREHSLGISPRRMGQHFLIDARALDRIVSALEPQAEDQMVEIGAGLGALTEYLLKSGIPLTAVERDRRFVQILQKRFVESNSFKVLHSDILKVDLAELAQQKPKSLLVAGNIPYSLTRPIMEYLVKNRIWIKRAILTIQKEVAQRIIAQPGNKTYTSLSLFVRVAFNPSIAFLIPGPSFYPKPRVTSAVLRLDPVESPVVPPEEEEAVLKLVRHLFTHRRKTLLNALEGITNLQDKETVKTHLEAGGISHKSRPEQLDLSQMCNLAQLLKSV